MVVEDELVEVPSTFTVMTTAQNCHPYLGEDDPSLIGTDICSMC